MQRALIDSGVSERRAVYHPNAIALQTFNPQFEFGKYALYVGRLSKEKGILTLLEALQHTKIPLRIAGTGPLEDKIRSQVEERGLRVQLEGYCTTERLAELYKGSAFTVVPSEWYENASMSALEAFAYGKPVLASDIGGLPELCIEAEVGRLFPSGDVDALARIATEMWANEVETIEMGRRARRRVETHFSQERRTADLFAIYDDVTGCIHP